MNHLLPIPGGAHAALASTPAEYHQPVMPASTLLTLMFWALLIAGILLLASVLTVVVMVRTGITDHPMLRRRELVGLGCASVALIAVSPMFLLLAQVMAE